MTAHYKCSAWSQLQQQQHQEREEHTMCISLYSSRMTKLVANWCLVTSWCVLGVLVPSVQSECVRQPWPPIDRSFDRYPLSVQCLAKRYLQCDDPDVLSSPLSYAVQLTETCGLRLHCQNGTSVEETTLGDNFFNASVLTSREFWVEIDGCSLERCQILLNNSGLVNTLHLFLPNNEIAEVSPSVFSDAVSTRSLNLSRNAIEYLDFDVFFGGEKLVPLEVFDASFNQIRAVKPLDAASSEDCCQKLEWLDLSHNQLQTVPSIFGRPESGREMRMFLANNNISSPQLVIPHPLRSLDLTGNGLTHIAAVDVAYRSHYIMHSLRLSNNDISSLESGVFNGLKLYELDLSDNSMSEIRGDVFSNLTLLKTLLLSGNRIEAIARKAFRGSTQLELLDLSRNKLQVIPSDLFAGLDGLESLRLSGNRLTAAGLPEGVFSGLALVILDLSENLLDFLDVRPFQDLSVSILHLSGCQLREFPLDLVQSLESSLRQLSISNNSISALPSVRYGDDLAIDFVDLSGNAMKEVNCFWLGYLIKTIYLHNNRITAVEECFSTEAMLAETRWSLSANPLRCCGIQWLGKVVLAAGTFTDLSYSTCLTDSGQTLIGEEMFALGDCGEEADADSTPATEPQTEQTCDDFDIALIAVSAALALVLLLNLTCLLLYCKSRNERRKEEAGTSSRFAPPGGTEPGYESTNVAYGTAVPDYEILK